MGAANTNKQSNTVKLHTPTFNRLKSLKHKGQSNDGFITELLDLYENDINKSQGIRSPNVARTKRDKT